MDKDRRFHFRMDLCMGCHACEVACSEQNGLPVDTQWRRVGEVQAGTFPDTRSFFISSGCNHCLEPACLQGCPVLAYKTTANGIVVHDDQTCIGCGYCTWNVPVNSIPTQRVNNYPQIIDGIIEGRIKALWIIATNPLVSFPDQNRLKRALKKLEFIAVQDGFHPTPTTEMADLLLPAAIWGEKEGCYTNSERRVSGVRAAVSPPGQAKPDFDIFMGLARQLGCRDALFPGWADPGDSFAEMQRVSKGRLCDYSGIRSEQLSRGGVQWPCNESRPEGTDSLYEDGVFQTCSGRARLLFSERKALEEETNSSFRLTLNTDRTVEHWHTGTKTTQVPILDKLAPCAWVEINPRTAKYFGIGPKDKVTLISARGRIDDLLVRITETIAPEQVFMPFHFAEQCTNLLTLPVFDPKSGQPNYKQCAVRILPTPKAY